MKIVMERLDVFKLRDVTLAIDIDGNMITIVATQKLKDGTYYTFHKDQFTTPNKEAK